MNPAKQFFDRIDLETESDLRLSLSNWELDILKLSEK